MKNLTAVVVSFLRPDYTIDCIKSLRKNYPEIKIIVGDQAGDKRIKKQAERIKAQYLALDWDCGVGASRNRIVEQIKTKYALIGDDDFLYDGSEMIDRMLKFIENNDFDLVGGRIFENGEVKDYQGFLQIKEGSLETNKITEEDAVDVDEASGLRYKQVDLTFNFFIAKTSILKKNSWDENIKVAYEHSHFFVNLKKAGCRIAFTPDPVVKHKFQNYPLSQQYKQFRLRKADKEYFFKSLGITTGTDIYGRRTFLNNDDKINNLEQAPLVWTEKITFLIKTFKGYDCLNKLLLSIKKYYPKIEIIIADDNGEDYFRNNFYKEWKLKLNISVIKLPFDCGLSYGRNRMVDRCRTPFLVILDDDFIFTDETDIRKMYLALKGEPQAGVIGGMCLDEKTEVHFECLLKFKNRELTQLPDGNNYRIINGTKVKETGCILNFAMFRRKVFKGLKWDDNLKVSEHLDFYLRFNKTDWKILYTPEVKVIHDRHRENGEYNNYRGRAIDYSLMMYRKNGIKRVININGMVSEMKDDKIIKYRIS